jgi:S-formylglutathione hydrolase FrmB
MSKRRRWGNLPALLFLSFTLTALPARAAGRAECLSLSSKILGRAVPYCVLLPPGYDTQKTARYPVLYFLHGLGENEQVLLEAGGMNLVEDLREQNQLGEFLIVTPAGGRSFFINSHDGRERYEDFLVREFLPFIERRYHIRPGRQFRGIAGVSMGGYGALRLAFRHPQLFGSVSAHSAALVDKLPALTKPNAQPSAFSRVLGAAFGSPPDVAFWERNSPFSLARNAPRPVGLKIYFDCGTEDDFGFNVGAKAFHDLLQSRGIPHEFHLYPGGHDWKYVAEHFAASLQFHSRAFGLGPARQ